MPKKKIKLTNQVEYIKSSPRSPKRNSSLNRSKLNTSKYSNMYHEHSITSDIQMIKNRDSINTKHIETLYDPDVKNPIKTFNERQFSDGQQRNLANFIDYRIDSQLKSIEMTDFKESLRREIDAHRQDSYLQIEHMYRTQAVKK